MADDDGRRKTVFYVRGWGCLVLALLVLLAINGVIALLR